MMEHVAHPFLHWAGGKRLLVSEIVKLLPKSFKDYWEPFLGGGAVFFGMDSHIRRAHLSDANDDLMLTYVMIKENTPAVINELRNHAVQHNKSYFRRT